MAEDQPLVEIQTDKTTVEIPSPAAGKVAQILVEEGKVVPVGTILVVIGEDGAAAEHANASADKDTSQSLAPGRAPAGRVRATPLVRRLAQELGVDLEQRHRHRPARTGDRSGRARSGHVRGSGTGTCLGGTARAASRGAARDRRAHGPRAQGGAGGHVGRGVRLLERRPQAPRPDRAQGRRRDAAGVPRAERAARGRRDRVPRPLRPRHRRPDRRRSRRTGRPRLRLGLGRRARRGGQAPRGSRPQRAPSSPRSSAARRSRSRAPASSPGCSRPRSSTTPRSRSSASAGSPSARSYATASSRSPRPATSRSRSTTAWSTEPAPPSSAWRSSAGSKARRNEKSPADRALRVTGRVSA